MNGAIGPKIRRKKRIKISDATSFETISKTNAITAQKYLSFEVKEGWCKTAMRYKLITKTLGIYINITLNTKI